MEIEDVDRDLLLESIYNMILDSSNYSDNIKFKKSENVEIYSIQTLLRNNGYDVKALNNPDTIVGIEQYKEAHTADISSMDNDLIQVYDYVFKNMDLPKIVNFLFFMLNK